jgi:dTDP-4-amino-4,6-dideoxygalactose transaminase
MLLSVSLLKPYAAALSSGTAAMHLALRVLAVIYDMENCMKQESVVSLFYNFIECFGVRT